MKAQDVVDTQVDAFNSHNVEAFITTYAEDCVVSGVRGSSGDIRGREAMRAHYQRRLAQPGLRADILQRAVMGCWIVDHEIVYTAGDPEEAVVVYEVRGSHIKRMHAFRGSSETAGEVPEC